MLTPDSQPKFCFNYINTLPYHKNFGSKYIQQIYQNQIEELKEENKTLKRVAVSAKELNMKVKALSDFKVELGDTNPKLSDLIAKI